jgi:hypothetical protein
VPAILYHYKLLNSRDFNVLIGVLRQRYCCIVVSPYKKSWSSDIRKPPA